MKVYRFTEIELRKLVFEASVAYARCGCVQEGEWNRAEVLQRYLDEKDAA
ncbi:MAG: hypothetical protein ACREMR_12160 [Gemmatimonadales bacterium]